MSSLRASLSLAVPLVLALSTGAARAGPGQTNSESGVGSIDEYLSTKAESAKANALPRLGIEFTDGEETLQHRNRVDGVKVLSVLPGSPSAVAGLQGERPQIQAALTLGLMAASVFFPPAMLGIAVIGSCGIGTTDDLIIAVDGERTHDVTDFSAAVDQAEPGEVVYLTVVSRGQRKQLRVELPYSRP